MTSNHTSNHGAVCPACKRLLDPLEKNDYLYYFEMILCPYCITQIDYHLCNFEKPNVKMIQLVEELSGKPYWEYQLYKLGQVNENDELLMKVKRHAEAMKKRSEFKLM